MRPPTPTSSLLGVILGVVALCSAYSIAQAQQSQSRPSQFQNFEGDGYYWYKKDPEPKPEVKPKIKPPNPPKPAAPAGPAPLSTQWLRENLPKLLDAAIDNPTKENVANYMYAQRIVLDKSQNYSQAVKEVVATDPFLDENNRIPVSGFAQLAQQRDIKKSQDSVLSHLATKSGIWVFVDHPEKCSACEAYVSNVLTAEGEGIASKYGFSFKKINVATPEGKIIAKKFNLKITPTTALVVPPAGVYLVSQGLMARDQLYERILVASKSYGLLPKELQDAANPYNKGVTTQEQLEGISASADPSDVMRGFRQRIHGPNTFDKNK